ncbi:MAG: hypothetical protein E6K45_06315 [Gammaproteobacteria bacterium]|nr:MAG: hypothetical protein E6K45_06315 [Gammaproteobacteria bacterium]
MDAALEMMHSFRQAGDLQLAALKDASAGHLDVPEAAGTFRNRRLAVVEGGYETTPEFRHLGEGVRLTALVDYDEGGALVDRDFVGLTACANRSVNVVA